MRDRSMRFKINMMISNRHNITEILWKVTINTITPTPPNLFSFHEKYRPAAQYIEQKESYPRLAN